MRADMQSNDWLPHYGLCPESSMDIQDRMGGICQETRLKVMTWFSRIALKTAWG